MEQASCQRGFGLFSLERPIDLVGEKEDGKKNYKVSIEEEGCKKVDKKFIEVIDSNECVDPKYCNATCKGVSHEWCGNGIHKREDGDDHSNDNLTPQCIYDKSIYKCRHRIDIKETKCNEHDRKRKCNKHNHCTWNKRDDICEYKDKCKNLGNKKKCKRRDDCKWDNGDCVKCIEKGDKCNKDGANCCNDNLICKNDGKGKNRCLKNGSTSSDDTDSFVVGGLATI